MRRARVERLADRAGLGAVEAVYAPRIAPLLWFAAGVAASVGATALWERFGAPGDAGPGRVVWPLVGVSFAIVCLVLVVATALDRGRRIAVCRGGVLHLRRSRLDAVPWRSVKHLRRRSRTSYELDADDGTSIHVTASLPESEAHRLDGQHQVIEESLRRLTALAEAVS